MAKITADDVHFVRIGGVTNGSGTVYTFTTRTPPATWSGTGTSVNALQGEIKTKPAAMKFMGTLATSPGIGVTLARRTETADLIRAKNRLSATVKTSSTGAAVRLTRFAGKSLSALSVTDSAPFSVGSYYWIGAQAFKVTGKPDSTTINVNRQQLGTYSEAIPMPSIDDITASGGVQLGPTIHTEPPAMAGLPMTAGVIDSAGAEEIRFRGFVDSVLISAGMLISVSARSIIQHIRNARYALPRAYAPAGPLIAGGGDISTGSISIQSWPLMSVDADLYGPSVSDGGEEWTRARWVGNDGSWLVTTVTYYDTETINGRKFDRYAHTPPRNPGAVHTVPVHAFGKDDEIWFLENTEARLEHMRSVFLDLNRAEWAHTTADPAEWSLVVLDMITRDEPYGSGMGINADYLSPGWSGTGDAHLPEVGNLLPGTIANTGLNRDAWVMPAMKSKKWQEVLRDGFFRPVWRGLGVDSSARIRALDWLDSGARVTPTPITSAHAIEKAEYKIGESSFNAIGLYVLQFATVSRFITSTADDQVLPGLVSVFAPAVQSAAVASPDEMRIPGTLAGDRDWRPVIVGIAQEALKRYGSRVRELTISLQPSVNVSPGDHITISMPHLPSSSGVVDVSSAPTLKGFALGVGIDKGRIQSARFAITGYVDDPSPTLGTWAPVATVTGWDAGTEYATISANNWTSTTHPIGITADYKAWDLLDWAGGETAAVIICDADFSTLGTGTLENVHSTLGLKLTGTTATPAAGNLIIPAAYDSQTAALKAATWQDGKGGPVVFLSGSNGELGAAGADGFGWLA